MCDKYNWLLAILWFTLTKKQQASHPWNELTSWKVPGSSTGEWRCLEKYFKRYFRNPKVQDNQSTERAISTKSKTPVLPKLLIRSQLLHPLNIKIRMGSIWALPECQTVQQLACMAGLSGDSSQVQRFHTGN